MKRIACAILIAAVLLGMGTYSESATIGSLATEDEMTDVINMDLGGVPPVTADMLKDGVYPVDVDSSSAMFKVVGCTLTVENESMTARLYMKSKAYSYMYAGTAQEAVDTAIDQLIPLMENEIGLYFDLPLDALDSAYICAALSERKQAWYPRTLVFRSASLPLEAFLPEFLTAADTLGLADGLYACEVTLEGKGRPNETFPGIAHPCSCARTDLHPRDGGRDRPHRDGLPCAGIRHPVQRRFLRRRLQPDHDQ